MDKLITVKNLVWEIQGKKIVDIKDFSISPGENTAIIGRNGSGKSSFIKLVSLLQQPSSGQISYRYSICDTKSLDVRRRISVVFQEPLLLRGTVYDNVALGLKLRKVPVQSIRKAVKKWLELFNIRHLSDQNVRHLSGGESQRVSLARAMVTEPELLILDEPFSSLDAPTRAGVIQDFCDIVRNSPAATIFITHYTTEIPLIADKVYVFEKGKIIEHGSPNKVLNYPDSIITANLAGIENIMEGQIIEQGRDALLIDCKNIGRLLVQNRYTFNTGTKVKVLIKPDMIKIGSLEEYNCLDYDIGKIYPLHSSYKLCGTQPPNLVTTVDKETFISNNLYTNKQTRIFIPKHGIHLIKNKQN